MAIEATEPSTRVQKEKDPRKNKGELLLRRSLRLAQQRFSKIPKKS